MTLYRHGDVLISRVEEIPERAIKQSHLVLLEGEVTGHAHRVETDDLAELYKDFMADSNEDLFLRIEGSPARVTHEEHDTIELPVGLYKVWRQREYDPRDRLKDNDWRWIED